MILVDSCVWIDLLKGNKTLAVTRLEQIQQDRAPEICISSVIYFEVLRGIDSDIERKRVQRGFDLLETRNFFPEGFDRLLEIYHAVRRKGISVSKLGDWLILKTVLDHSITLLTSDGDFHRLHKLVPFSLDYP